MLTLVQKLLVSWDLFLNSRFQQRESAFTLLEYCIGAAALGAIIFVALQALGTGIGTYLTNLGAWFGGQQMPN
jgi:Flp pilus assembly pilin Flp